MGLSGHCLCGSVKYTVDADPLIVGYDHCDDCQRQTGSTYCTSILHHIISCYSAFHPPNRPQIVPMIFLSRDLSRDPANRIHRNRSADLP